MILQAHRNQVSAQSLSLSIFKSLTENNIFPPLTNTSLFTHPPSHTPLTTTTMSTNGSTNPNANKVAIVGGGPAGLALAAILEKQGGIDYILYESSAEEVPPRGGCLDLHLGSGQRALREAGVFEEFKKYGRYGDATIHRLFDHQGNNIFDFGEGRDAPEIDRWALRKVLLSGIPAEKVVWKRAVQKVERDAEGKVVLGFADGTTETGFKLVVGADGTWSKVRHLVRHHPPPEIPSGRRLTSGRSPTRSRRTRATSSSRPRSTQPPPSTPRCRSSAVRGP